MTRIYFLIPYILGAIIDQETDVEPTFTFYGRIDTLFTNTSTNTQNNSKSNACVHFRLECKLQFLVNLTCYIPKNSIFYSPSTDPAHIVKNNRVFTPSALIYDEKNFTIMYNLNGAMYCHIEEENVANKSILLKIYQAIGDQLSIGIKTYKLKELYFYEQEIFINGTCQTYYQFTQDEYTITNKYMLHTYIENDDMPYSNARILHVKKFRRVDKCSPLRNFILGKILWTDLLKSEISELTISYSQLLFAAHNFATKSVNIFDLYEESEKVGSIRETIEVNLISIQT